MADESAGKSSGSIGSNRSLFYIILLGLLLAINVYLYLKYRQRNQETIQLTELVNADSIRLADLDLRYQEALINIESYKGQNAKLDSLIAIKERELLQYRDNLASLQRKKKISEEEYNKQLSTLQGLINDLQDQITHLQEENKILILRNDSLGKSLAEEINTSRVLTTTNEALSKKVAVGSLLRPTSFTGTGARNKSGGKEDETTSARKAEKLKVCFSLPTNDIAEPGEKSFYVRIISPEGVTLASQSSGSGTLNRAEGGDPIQYTTLTYVNYEKEPVNACVYWQQESPYGKGVYATEIYQDGYLVGSGTFELK